MNEKSKTCDESGQIICNNRREFLVKASVVAGGVVLGLSGAKSAQAQKDNNSGSKNTGAPSDEIVLKLDEKSPLGKVGGFDTIETKAGKIVVVRTADMSFSAYSAVCPHKGGPIEYDEKTQQLFCPSHNSRFDTAGKVVKGPAKTPLKVFATQKAIVVALDANR
jgi:cytochrome b6-f complex iron-sulfur subunit